MVDRKINIFTKVTGAGAVKGLTASMGALLAVVGLVGAALIGLTKAAIGSVSKFLEFEKSVIKINVLLGKTERATANVKERLLELRKAVPTAEFEDLSDAVFTLQSLLGDTEASFELAELAAKAAAATNTDVADVTKALATNIKIFNLNTEESVAWLDKYVKAVNSGIITGEKLSKQVDEGAIAMNRLGASTEETLAVYSTLGGALREEAIKTGLKALANEVLRDKEKFEEAGVATSSFIDLLNSLEGKDIATLGFQGESIQLLEILVASKDQYLEMVDTITNSEGELDDTFSAIEESAGFIFDKASASVDDFAIRAGENFSDVGAAFVTAMGEAGIEEAFDDILAIIVDMKPLLVGIAEIIGTGIGGATVKLLDDWRRISDVITKVDKLLFKVDEKTEKNRIELSKILNIFDLLIDQAERIVGHFEVWGDIIKGNLTVLEGTKLMIADMNQGLREFLGLSTTGVGQTKGAGGAITPGMSVGPLPAEADTSKRLETSEKLTEDAEDRKEIEQEITQELGKRQELHRQRQKSQIDTEKEDRIKAEEDAQKRLATGTSKAIVSALFSGDVAAAFRAVFGGLAQKLLTNALQKGIGSLLSLIPGIGGFLGAIFGAEGFSQKGVLQLARGGAFSRTLTGAIPAIIGEKPGVKETAAALPHNLDGSRVLLNDVLPNFPDVVSAIQGGGGQTVVNINPSVSPLLDIEIAERNIRGNRMRANDIAQ